MSEFDKRADPALPEPVGWLPTATGQYLLNLLAYAHLEGDNVVACGGAGLGKTFAAEEFQRTTPGVWIATMSPSAASLTGSLERIAQGMGVPEKERLQGAARMEQAIIAWAREAGGLLVVDEAHFLGEAAMAQVLSLRKVAGVGVVLLGHDSLYRQLSRDKWLMSQLGWKLRLDRPAPGDVSVLLDAWEVQGRKARGLCAKIARKPGTLRILWKVLRWAKVKAMFDGAEFGLEHIKMAWREMAGNF